MSSSPFVSSALVGRVFVSTSTYALGRELGHEAAVAEVHRQLADPGFESLECVRVIHRLRHLSDVELYIDTGATVIGKARSRAFTAAVRSEADVWVTVDDDVDASSDTLAAMLQAVYDVAPRVVLAPCLLRRQDRAIANVEMPHLVVERRLPSGALLRQCGGGGFGLVAMNRAALKVIAESSLVFVDDDGVEKWAPFLELIERDKEGRFRWWGEDRAFFKRCPAAVSVEALCTGNTVHAGLPLDLRSLA